MSCSLCHRAIKYTVDGTPLCGIHCPPSKRTAEYSIDGKEPVKRTKKSTGTSSKAASTAGGPALDANDPTIGVSLCQKENCKNSSRYKVMEECVKYYCGNHCRGKARTELRKDQDALKKIRNDRYEELAELIESRKGEGCVIMSKLPIIGYPKHTEGYISAVITGKKIDFGYSFPELSPMNIGPVCHVMPNLPPSQNIENYWQFAKVYQDDHDSHMEIRKKGYEDKEGHRHGCLTKEEQKKKPTFSFIGFFSNTGDLRRYDYIQARAFYCHYYEKLASQTEQFQELVKKKSEGYNIELFGYDSFTPLEDIMCDYTDPKKPFGHEAVLYCMLTIDDGEQYPWNIYMRQHPDMYVGMFSPRRNVGVAEAEAAQPEAAQAEAAQPEAAQEKHEDPNADDE